VAEQALQADAVICSGSLHLCLQELMDAGLREGLAVLLTGQAQGA
jgi:hypothetical protein